MPNINRKDPICRATYFGCWGAPRHDHDQLYTSSRGAALPLADQIKAARTVEPAKPLLAVRPAGDPGRIYSELAASWLWVTALAGLALWWTGRRNGSRLRPTRQPSKRLRTLSWHGALGTWVVLGMLMLSATGLT